MRVLIIETHLQTAYTISQFFEDRGDEVWHAWKLDEANALINLIQPDLLLMELHLLEDEWIDFLRHTRQAFPSIKIVMTSKHPDLQREVLAQQYGKVRVFVRQPFTRRWLQQSLERLDDPSFSSSSWGLALSLLPPARVPLYLKITFPFLLLLLLFAIVGYFLTGQVLREAVENQFYDRLGQAAARSGRWLARQEQEMLSVERLIVHTHGLGEALAERDSEMARTLSMPLIIHSGEEAVAFLTPEGTTLLSLYLQPTVDPPQYVSMRGEDVFLNSECASLALQGVNDRAGDKFSGLVRLSRGYFLFTCAPLHDSSGKITGAVLVGRSLQNMAQRMQAEVGGEFAFYDPSGEALSASLAARAEQSSPAWEEIGAALGSSGSARRSLQLGDAEYKELLLPWQVRGGKTLGVLGISLAQPGPRASRSLMLMIGFFAAAAVVLCVVVGLLLSGELSRLLRRLTLAAREISRGNLEVHVESSGEDEASVLAHAFNYMVAGLQEVLIYRDLLGRSVPAQTIETLRESLSSGAVRLEGQDLDAAILVMDIKGFTRLSETTPSARVFDWLSEYYDTVLPVAAEFGGVVNKFEGDGMLFHFGVLPKHMEAEQSAYAALRAAQEILRAVNRLNRERLLRGDPPLNTGIGVHSGRITAGGLGTRQRHYFTIIGDPVNTALRLERLSRQMLSGSAILASQALVAALGGRAAEFAFEHLGEHPILAKSGMMGVLQVKE